MRKIASPELTARGENIFAAVVAIVFVGLVLLCHARAGLGFDTRPDAHGSIATGFLGDLRDNESYVAWAEQARDGATLFALPDATVAQPPLYFNPFFLVLGLLSRALGLSLFGLLNALGLVGAAVAIFCTYHAARAAGLSARVARTATVLLPFSLGGSSVVAAWCALRGISRVPHLGADVRAHDLFAFSCFLTTPFQAVTWALTTLLALCLLRALARPSAATLSPVAALACLAAFVRPYEAIALLASYALFLSLTFVHAAERPQLRARLTLGTILLAAVAPALGYALWLTRHEAWKHFAAASLSLVHGRAYFLVGYGALLPLALVGAIRAWRVPRPAGVRLLSCWVLLVVSALIGFDTAAIKIAAVATLPMWLLAAQAMHEAVAALQGRARVIATAGLVVALGAGVCTSAAFVVERLRKYEPQVYAYSVDVLAAARAVAGEKKRARILCDTDTGAALPALANVAVYAGNELLTPDYSGRLAQLLRAGFPRPLGSVVAVDTVITPDAASFDALLASTRADYLLVRADMLAATFAQKSPRVRDSRAFGDWTLYRLN